MPIPLHFRIERWAAWAPGLSTPAQWLAWFENPTPLEATGMPPLAEMAAMLRRRLDPLGRVALQAAYDAQGNEVGAPVVFASRWAELARTEQLLQELSAGVPLSPTQFSLSVHNAVGALYSIARAEKGNYLAVAAGRCSVEAGFVEAMGLLADGAPQVLVVVFDGPLPPHSATAFRDDAPLAYPHAIACLLAPAEQGGFSLRAGGTATETTDALPDALQVLKFLVHSKASQMPRSDGLSAWTWELRA